MQLSFLGAAGTVTGSKYLLELNHKKILIDCGLFQGKKALTDRNWDTLPIHPSKIDAVILTHAHLDHSGYVPFLVKEGYKGPIYSTPGTKELCALLLPDSGSIQEEKAHYANKHAVHGSLPVAPLYTEKEAHSAIKQFVPVAFDQVYTLADNCHFRFVSTAHILGAACIYLTYNNTTILFSGDLGRLHDPIMREPAMIAAADYIVVESTYGDRIHDPEPPQAQLAQIINATIAQQGVIVIPAFAVGRTQSILYHISQLKERQLIPNIPVFLDSPLAEAVTDIYTRYIEEHRLGPEQCAKLSSMATYINTSADSKSLDDIHAPAIIVASSGMATGGRILQHIKTFAPHTKNTMLFTGYQAEETLGEEIVKGHKEVEIHGEKITIHGQVAMLNNMSAHADSIEILSWLSHLKKPPRKIFITHGEPEASAALKQKIATKLNWDCIVPEYLQKVNLLS